MHSPHLDLSLQSRVWLKIMNATIDRSLGEGLARRHPPLDIEGAQVLRDYYGRTAAAFMAWGDSQRARVCAEAEVNVRHALRAAEISS